MGNTNTSCQMSNYSKRNVRVFVRGKALEMDAFLTSQPGGPAGKTFSFKKGSACVRVLASQTQEVPIDAHHFLSVFVEDGDDENICSKQIIHNMTLSTPVTLLLYDV